MLKKLFIFSCLFVSSFAYSQLKHDDYRGLWVNEIAFVDGIAEIDFRIIFDDIAECDENGCTGPTIYLYGEFLAACELNFCDFGGQHFTELNRGRFDFISRFSTSEGRHVARLRLENGGRTLVVRYNTDFFDERKTDVFRKEERFFRLII